MSSRGLLEPGYRGPNSVVAEPYIDRGAPYWAAQGLVILLIPENDPFWTAREEPMPADGAGGRRALPGAEMLLKVSPIDGEARLYPVGQPFSHWGQWQRGIKYCQLAYSSYLGWCATGEGGPDLGAGRTGYSLDGKTWRFRERPRMVEVTDRHLFSREVMELPDSPYEKEGFDDYGEIYTHTLVGDDGEVTREGSAHRIAIAGGENHSVMQVVRAPSSALDAELLEPRKGWLHSHSFGGRGAFPHWQSKEPVHANTPVVLYVNGTRGRNPEIPPVTVETRPRTLVVAFEGRTYTIRVPD